MNVLGVKFKDLGDIVYVSSEIDDLKINDYVIVQCDRGLKLGKVCEFSNEDSAKSDFFVVRKALDSDYNYYLRSLKIAKDALSYAKEQSIILNLNINFVDSEFNFDRSLLFMNFTSDERVDFRELVKILAGKYRTRIELHQIGIRDKAKIVGGIGVCGRGLCCRGVLSKLDTVTINMAKNQNIALNPSKINGACGRLLCCLAYEDSTYLENRLKLPKVGSEVEYLGKKYVVLSINVLNKSYNINVDGDIKEIVFDEE